MRFIILFTFLICSMQTFAQKNDTPCPKPTRERIKELCETIFINDEVKGDDANYFAYTYERDLWDIACADPRKDSWEEGKAKIQKMWQQHKTLFVCHSRENVLKFAFNVSKNSVFDTWVSTYGLDINFIDPTDNLNLYDYHIKMLNESIKVNGLNHNNTKVLKEYVELIAGLGGKSVKSK